MTEELAQEIDRAFDYRGDVTVFTTDGSRLVGYLFNRNRDVAEPFVQIFPSIGGPAQTIAYAKISRVGFTGRNMAAEAERSRASRPDP